MHKHELTINGKVLHGHGDLSKYSEDRSPYRVTPQVVVIPKTAEDISKTVKFARMNNLTITARGAGSNLSGSAIGNGIVIDFSHMNSMIEHGKSATIGPGIVYDELNKRAAKHGYFLPYSPSSGAFCTVGGNISTKAAGLRSVKYGSVDNYVRSICFIDAEGRLIDTSKPLPPDLEHGIMELRKNLLKDRRAMALLRKKEKMKTSSGYNIFALYRYGKPEEICTHLLVGSVGTLGLIVDTHMALAPLPKEKATAMGYFKSLEDACNFVLRIKKLKPSAIEIIDSYSLDILREHSSHKIAKMAEAAILVEFDADFNHKKTDALLHKYSIAYEIETDSKRQEDLWAVRKDLLTIVEHKKKNVIAFVEDIGVPPQHLAKFIKDLQRIFKSNKIECVIFGHAGEGNLHLRPIVNHAEWKKNVHRIAELCYNAAFRYGGTCTCEHGMGRNKMPYITKEWGPVVRHFIAIKKTFDPAGILNPGIDFSATDITKEMKY